MSSVFFFQAEDGIRDLVRSRGLGDVYKRQGHGDTVRPERTTVHQYGDETRRIAAPGQSRSMIQLRGGGLKAGHAQKRNAAPAFPARQAVSYTHLTLPTSDLV